MVRIKNIKRKRSPFIIGLLFRIILIIFAIAMILSYISIFINPSTFKLPLLFGLFFIPLFGINLLLLIIALIRRSRSAWIPAIALIPSFFYTNLFIQIWNSTKSPNIENITIESYNVGMFYSSKEKLSRDKCISNISNHFRKNSPDIICLQEFFVESPQQADTLFKEYPYRYHHLFKLNQNSFFGNIILSKLPIINSGKIIFEKSTNHAIFADIQHKNSIFRIYNNHLESYNISFTSLVQKFFSSKNLTTELISSNLIETHNKILGTSIKRSDQVNTIANSIKKCSNPTIICGDFNDTPMSYTYHTLAKDKKDSFKEAGIGFSATFSRLYPLLRIDYILYPDNIFSCKKFITDKINFSDHFPIYAILTTQ